MVSPGGLLVIVAAVANASFALPMKRMPRWSWENIWLVWTVAALLVLPLLAALLTIPGLWAGYGEVQASVILRVAGFGMAWGIAQVLFGLTVAQIGMALTFSIVLGTSAAVGTVVPFVWLHADLLPSLIGRFVVTGVVLVAIGMALCAQAGRLREREQRIVAAGAGSMKVGLLLAFASGLCAGFMNLGISFAEPLLQMAARHGSQPYWRLNAVWLPLLIGGALPNLLYCSYLLWRRQSMKNFALRGTALYWISCLLMAVLWFGSSLLFGIASFSLGALGPVIGWPVFMSLIVICASFLGWSTGEWRTATRRPLQLQLAGLGMLIAAIVLFSRTGA